MVKQPGAKQPAAKRQELCPICGRPADVSHRPFCSPRCQEVDLGRWLTGGYAIPVPPDELDDDLPPSDEKA